MNITPVERSGRVVLGLAGATAGILLLIGAGSVLAAVLEILLVAAGVDLVITGALVHCPVYATLGHIPKSMRNLR